MQYCFLLLYKFTFHYLSMRFFNKYFVASVLVIAFLNGNAQKNKVENGYIITRQNDTIPCVFKARSWKKQPFQIRVSIGEKDSVITPEKIKAFFLISPGIEYESRLISPALYELNMQFAVGNDYKPFFDSANYAFLRLVYKGSISLFLYEDKIERKHFFLNVGDELTEIYKHLYSTAGGFHNTDPLVVWYNQYIKMLKVLMADCKSLFSIIDVMELKEESLVSLLKLYDKCMESKKSE